MRKHQQVEPLVKNGKVRHYDRFEELVAEMVQSFKVSTRVLAGVLLANVYHGSLGT